MFIGSLFVDLTGCSLFLDLPAGLLLVTGRGSHRGQAVLGPLLREWLEDDLGLPVEATFWEVGGVRWLAKRIMKLW